MIKWIALVTILVLPTLSYAGNIAIIDFGADVSFHKESLKTLYYQTGKTYPLILQLSASPLV